MTFSQPHFRNLSWPSHTMVGQFQCRHLVTAFMPFSICCEKGEEMSEDDKKLGKSVRDKFLKPTILRKVEGKLT